MQIIRPEDRYWEKPWRLAYYSEDDGIWLVHQVGCGWEQNLGYWPSPDDVMTAKQEHEDQPC